MNPDPPKPPSKSGPAIGRYLDLGLQFAVAIGLGLGFGWFLDSKFHTTPLFLILGILLGATSGFLNIYRAVFPSRKENRTTQNDREDR